MKFVQYYELFGGKALENHTFLYHALNTHMLFSSKKSWNLLFACFPLILINYAIKAINPCFNTFTEVHMIKPCHPNFSLPIWL